MVLFEVASYLLLILSTKMRPSNMQSLFLGFLMLKTCYCVSLPTSVVMLVPENNTVVLGDGTSNVTATYGLIPTASRTYGYATSQFFSLQYPNGVNSMIGGKVLRCLDALPHPLAEDAFLLHTVVDAAGVYIISLNTTFTFPVSGGNCSSGPFESQTELVSDVFNVLQGNSSGHNGTYISILKTFTTAPTGSVKGSAMLLSPSVTVGVVAFLLVVAGVFVPL